jgi:hypothetical protein
MYFVVFEGIKHSHISIDLGFSTRGTGTAVSRPVALAAWPIMQDQEFLWLQIQYRGARSNYPTPSLSSANSAAPTHDKESSPNSQ